MTTPVADEHTACSTFIKTCIRRVLTNAPTSGVSATNGGCSKNKFFVFYVWIHNSCGHILRGRVVEFYSAKLLYNR